MKKILYAGLLALAFLPFSASAADYSGDEVDLEQGSFTDELDRRSAYLKRQVVLADGEATLAQDENGDYVTAGSLSRGQGILKHHIEYFESASISMDADIPEGTSIDLYLRTIDPEESGGVHVNARTWTQVDEDEKINLGAFQYGLLGDYGSYKRNNLRWRAVLRTDDSSVTPTLHSVSVTFYNASPDTDQLSFLENTYGVNREDGASIKVTLYGERFQEGKEEVFLKNLFAASTVTFVNSKTLVAEFPIEDLSAGTYTVVVRNTETGRMYKTDIDGMPVNDPHGEADSMNLRLVLKWFPPVIHSFTPSSVSYTSGGTIIISGDYFSYGSRVMIRKDIPEEIGEGGFLPSDSVTLIDEHTLQVDVTSGIITSQGLNRDTNLTILVLTPDYQTVTKDGFYVD